MSPSDRGFLFRKYLYYDSLLSFDSYAASVNCALNYS